MMQAVVRVLLELQLVRLIGKEVKNKKNTHILIRRVTKKTKIEIWKNKDETKD